MILQTMNELKSFINKTVKIIGKYPVCNLKPERAPHIGNFCFILCWRCTATIGSMITFQIMWIITGRPYIYLQPSIVIPCGVFLIIPLCIDGSIQYIFEIESTNRRRIVTGILAGLGFWICYLLAYYKFPFIRNL